MHEQTSNEFTANDMASARAEGFRDGVASLPVGVPDGAFAEVQAMRRAYSDSSAGRLDADVPSHGQTIAIQQMMESLADEDAEADAWEAICTYADQRAVIALNRALGALAAAPSAPAAEPVQQACPVCDGAGELHHPHAGDEYRCEACDGAGLVERVPSLPPAGVEEPIVVGVRISTDGFGSYIADSAMGIGSASPGDVREPLMTVAQCQRIVAALESRIEDAEAHAQIEAERADNAGRNASVFEDRMGDLQIENGKLRDQIAALSGGVRVPKLAGLQSVSHQLGIVALSFKNSEQTQEAVRYLRALLAQAEQGGGV